jgi:hypothetical protein
MQMRRKAGLLIAGAAVAVTAAVATAVVFGAGIGGSGAVKRTHALHLQARIDSPAVAKAAGATAKHKPPFVVYGSTKPQAIPPNAETSVILGGCPKRYHITNGSVAAVQGQDALNFTIRGSGPLATKRGAVKRWFVDLHNSNTTFPVNALGFIVCERR